ncbi:MAG TPA: ABC transporter permease [Microthrixaceae bacterium]|nr:ABC transporter permease [Microthrixaceae bacterium]
MNLAQRDLKARYKRSFVGWMWSLINPAATLGIYTLVFGFFLKGTAPVAGNGTLSSFALYLFCGLVVWNLFAGVVNTSIGSFATAGPLLTRTYFPPECPMVAGLTTVVLQSLIEAGILIFFMAIAGNVSWTVIIVLPIFTLMSCFAFGIGLVLGLLNIRFRDVSYLVGIAMQVLFYATPIVYSLEIIPANFQKALRLNPLTSYVHSMRQVVYSLELPTASNWAVMVLTALISLIGGWAIFSRWAPSVIEEL